MSDVANPKNAFEVILKWQTRDLPIDQRITRAEELLVEGVRAKDDDVCVAAFVWLYDLLDEQALSPDRPKTNWALHPLVKIVSLYWRLPDRDGGVCLCIKTKYAVLKRITEKYWHAGDSEVFNMAFDFILTVGWPPQVTPFHGWLRDGCGRTCSMDERKFITGIIREKFETPAFDLSYLVAIARRTGGYLPNDVGTLLFHALARKGEGSLLATFIKYMDFWERVGATSLSAAGGYLLEEVGKNWCPILDAAAVGLQKRLVGGAEGMDVENWREGTRVYGRVIFRYQGEKEMTVDIELLGDDEPVSGYVDIMMARATGHIRNFQRDEGIGISVLLRVVRHDRKNIVITAQFEARDAL